MNQQDRLQQAAEALASASGQSPVQAKRVLSEYDTRDLIASVAAEGVGGGGSVVSCLLARDANIDIHEVGDHNILWDGLYDDIWNFNVLAGIPDGLGLSFAFDGSSADIATTESGVWSLDYFIALGGTDGTISVNTGVQTLRAQPYTGDNSPVSVIQVAALPSGQTFTQKIVTAAGANPDLVLDNCYLSIVRLA